MQWGIPHVDMQARASFKPQSSPPANLVQSLVRLPSQWQPLQEDFLSLLKGRLQLLIDLAALMHVAMLPAKVLDELMHLAIYQIQQNSVAAAPERGPMLVAPCRANEALKQRDAGQVVASLERSLEAEVNAKVTAQAAVEGALHPHVRHQAVNIQLK